MRNVMQEVSEIGDKENNKKKRILLSEKKSSKLWIHV